MHANVFEGIATSTKERACRKLERDLGGLLLNALSDYETVEIMLNPDGRVWQEKLGQGMMCIEELGCAQAESIIKTVAGFHGKEITRGSPVIEGEFPLDSSRFAGQIPPVVSAPCFAIRKKALQVFTLEDYLDNGVLSRAHYELIIKSISKHCNILVIGGTGSGKTTLINAIIHKMVSEFPNERIVILEDTSEIQCHAQNFVQYHTTPEVSMTQLLRTTLRMRPDRILVGEVRGAEALDLLDAWNTGHEGGAATLHANNAKMGLVRLESLISRNSSAPKDIKRLIADAIDLIVHISRTPSGRQIKEVINLQDIE